jgi:hypothetical protein
MSWKVFDTEEKIEDEHRCGSRPRLWVEDEIKDITRYGSAIGSIIKVEGHWLADNGEYASEINYCPFCGLNLKGEIDGT